MSPLGSFGGFQVMLTEVSVSSSLLSSDTGPGTIFYVGKSWEEQYYLADR